MRFQNWLIDEQLIIEAVEIGVILEAMASEEEIEAAAEKAKRDPAAIGDLLAILRPVIEIILARKIRGGIRHPEFQDIVQDVMMAVWRNLRGELGSPVRGPLKPWLAAIIYRMMLNRVRGQKADSLQQIFAKPEDNVRTDDDHEETVDREEALSQAIAQLSQMDREILQLYFFNDLSHAEIAKRLGIPEPTSKRRLFDAKQNLRKALERLGIEGAI
jgi:RNA polymerase sigma-70 factor (ECF subfamily)